MSRQFNMHGPMYDTTGQLEVAQGMHVLPSSQYQGARRSTPHFASQADRSRPVNDNDNFLERLMSAIGPVLASHQQATTTRIEQLENSIESLSNELASTRQESQTQTRNVVQYLEQSHCVQQSATKTLTSRIKRLENDIGTNCDQRSVVDRLDNLTLAVQELLETAKDPCAVHLIFPS
jgi:hypothetical protein